MSERAAALLKRCATTAVAGLAVAFALFYFRGGLEATAADEILMLLCDAFTLPGVVLLSAGALIFVANNGFFNGVSYVFSQAANLIIPGLAVWRKHESYGDFVERKREKGGVKNYGFIPITGAVFLAVALILLVAFSAVS